ncbi:MAG: DNA recombination protein RmuC [Edaphobacter sp.]
MQEMMIVWFGVGGAVGAVVGWLLANSKEQSARAVAAAQLEARDAEAADLRVGLAAKDQVIVEKDRELDAARDAGGTARVEAAGLRAQLLAEQKATGDKLLALKDMEESLKTSFQALAASALNANSKQLMELAKGELGKQQVEAANKLAEKESAIATLLGPMKDSLAKLSTHSQELEVKREGAYQAVLAEIQNIQKSHTDLRKETTQLVQALRAPKVRGNWGEMQLRRCVEFAGMVEYASFEVEKFVRGEESSMRPDMVVKLPNGRCIIVDAKTPLSAFLDASACEDETLRHGHMLAHARQVRSHLDSLSGKAYWNRLVESPDFVVCFLPSEVLFSAALEHDPGLLEYSASSNVLLATPTTLIALLKAVAYGWQQSQIARDAEKIRDAAMVVHSKLAGMHAAILDLGKRLKAAGDAYDDMLVKAEGRGGLFSVSRRLRELKIGEKDLPESKPVGMQLRGLEADDWQQSGLSLVAEAEADGAGE